MTDVLRASWVFPDFDSLYSALSVLYSELGPETVLRIKDRFQPDQVDFGYRDVMLNVRCFSEKFCF